MRKIEKSHILQKKNLAKAVALFTAVTVFAGSVNLYDIKAKEQEQKEAAQNEKEENLLTKVLDQATGSVSKNDVDVSKEETVYIISDAAGNPTETIVSDWLKNPEGAETLSDATDLTDIENVKGDETYKKGDGNHITWQADGADIYYQGTSTKESPIEVKISYFLDDKEVSADEIAGKSGKVKIRFDYTNHQKETIKVAGKEEEVCVPFAVLSGMILPVENFTNVSVTNGKVISEGNNNIIVGLAFPGLEDSLDIDTSDSDMEIPQYVEVTANAKDFELSMTLSVAMSDILDTVDISGDMDLSELTDKMDDLTDATDQLLDGTDQLADGAGKLKDGTATLADGAGTLNSKKGDLTSGASKLATGIKEYTDGVNQLSNGITSLKDGTAKMKKNVPALITGVNQLKAGSASAKSGADQLVAGFEGGAGKIGAVDGAKQVAAGVSQLASQLGGLTSGIEATVNQTEQQYVDQANASLGALGISVSTDPASIQGAINTVNGLKSQAMAGLEQINNGIGSCDTAITMYTNLGDAETAATYQAQKDQLVAQKPGVEGKITQLDSAVGSLNQLLGMIQALEGVKGQLGGAVSPETQASLQALVAGANSLSQGVEQLYQGTKQLDTGLGTLDAGLGTLQSNGKTLSEGVTQLDNGAKQLKEGANKLTDNSANLVNGGSALVTGTNQIADAIGKISDGATELDNGAGELKNGANKLSDGMIQFNEEGIEKITKAFDDTGDVTDLFDRIKAVMNLGKEYQSFSQLADGTKGSVKFIIKTDAVKAD